MKNNREKASHLSYAAVVAAAYVVLTLAFAPISFGVVQFRVSEVLCVLPFFLPSTAAGLFIGCIVANVFSGNVLDIVFGSLATLLAALLTAFIGRRRKTVGFMALSCAVITIINALAVGAVITKGYTGLSILNNPGIFALNCLQVGLGEAVVLFAGGLPLMLCLSRKIFTKKQSDRPAPVQSEEEPQ